MKKVLLVKMIALFSAIVLLTSCGGLNVKNESSVKKFLCKNAFSHWQDDNEENGAVSTFQFTEDGNFTANIGGDVSKGVWKIGEFQEANSFVYKSRVIELEYTSGEFKGQKVKANLMEENKVLNLGGDVVCHIDKRY